MRTLIKLLKGICIGVSNVVPGFSGATMAIIVNIYEEMIDSISSFFKHPIQVLKKSWSLFLGIVLGIVIALFTIVKLLENFPLIIILFFIGLIIGDLPFLIKKVEIRKIALKQVLTLVIPFLVVILLPLLQTSDGANIELNFLTYLILFLLGAISISAMIIPGVSGSLVLMIFGYYGFFMMSLKEGITSFFSFDFETFFDLFGIILSFVLGAICGVLAFSKFIKFLYSKHETIFNFGVIGLLLASPFAIMLSASKEYENIFAMKWYEFLVGFIALCLGFCITYISHKKIKKDI